VLICNHHEDNKDSISKSFTKGFEICSVGATDQIKSHQIKFDGFFYFEKGAQCF